MQEDGKTHIEGAAQPLYALHLQDREENTDKECTTPRDRVPTLQALCETHVMSWPFKLQDVLQIYQVADLVFAKELKSKYLNFLISAFPGLKEMAGEEVLLEVMGEEIFNACQQRDLTEQAEQAKLKRIREGGRVMEREAPVLPVTSTSTINDIPIYPYEVLKVGVKWPDDVNPSKREQHLDSNAFVEVFGVDRATFAKWPGWKITQKKKEVLLF